MATAFTAGHDRAAMGLDQLFHDHQAEAQAALLKPTSGERRFQKSPAMLPSTSQFSSVMRSTTRPSIHSWLPDRFDSGDAAARCGSHRDGRRHWDFTRRFGKLFEPSSQNSATVAILPASANRMLQRNRVIALLL